VIRVGVVGLGKMGLSHHALLNAHPEVEVVGVCDSAKYVLGVLEKNTGVATFTDYGRLLAEAKPEAVVIATPSRFHVEMVRTALEHDIHVFCEKPLTLTAADANLLAELAAERGLVTQVGYHNRFVAAFQEVKRLLDSGAIGEITHVMGEAYGPVVLKPKGKTWRSRQSEGGGCLFDYAAHVINLVHWYMGAPAGVGGTVLPRIFSSETDDGALSTLYFDGGKTGQISVDWSDESYRKMTTRVTVWGTAGRIFADRQECQTYLREDAKVPAGYEAGWNVRYTTELTKPVWFYLRGEEYSAQLEAFVERVGRGEADGEGGFQSAAITDRTIAMMVADAERGPSTLTSDFDGGAPATPAAKPRRRALWRRAAV
jgi:predicted dehydrogenase